MLLRCSHPDFWRNQFADVAQVYERIEFCSNEQSLLIALRRLARRRWRKPMPIPLKESQQPSAPPPRIGDMLWRQLERVAGKVARNAGPARLSRLQPSEYGLFVEMVKK